MGRSADDDLDALVTAEPPAPRRRRRWPWVVVGVIVFALVAAAGVALVYLFNLNQTYTDNVTMLDESETFPDVSVRPDPVDEAHADARNILLLGSDIRGDVGDDLDDIRGQRSDTMMIVHIPADNEGVQVMSIMRDNWVPIPGYGEAKINAALSYGGVPLTVQTIEDIIDVRIDHVAIVDFEGFAGLTDALGGVDVINAVPFTRSGVAYPEGHITLDGESALGFVRERYSFVDGDYQRVRNQQAYLRGLIRGLLSRDTLTDPGKISNMVGAISPYLTVDSGLDGPTIVDLGLRLRDLRAEDIDFFTSPTLGTGTSADGQSIVRPDWDALAQLAEAFRSDNVDEYVATAR